MVEGENLVPKMHFFFNDDDDDLSYVAMTTVEMRGGVVVMVTAPMEHLMLSFPGLQLWYN